MNILNSIDLFLEHCEYEKNLSKKTLEAYKIDLLQFERFLKLKAILSIDQIDKLAIKAYVQHLSKFEVRTTKRKIASSKAFLNFLEFEDHILVNPYRKIKIRLKEPQQLPAVLEFEEVKHLFQLITREGEKISNKSSCLYGEKLRDLSVLELLFATGIRVSELCGLRLDDVNLETGDLLIRGKGNKERRVQVCNSETSEVLKKYHRFHEAKIIDIGFFLLAG